MRGITQARLLEIMNEADPRFDEIMNNCTELTPWLPIADAPKDRFLLLYSPDIEGVSKKFAGRIESCWYWKPTHYQELPADPIQGTVIGIGLAMPNKNPFK